MKPTRPVAVHTTRAWSCTVRLAVGDERALTPAAQDLDALLAAVDRAASRFRPDSALSIANRRAGRPTVIPRVLVGLVAAGIDAAVQTDGLVDPCLGLAMRRIGYDRDIAAVQRSAPPAAALPGPHPQHAWRRIRLDADAGLLTVPPGTELDLGATAKAYVADHAAHALARRYATSVLVELGGDIAVAGRRADGWCVRVAEREGGVGQSLLLRHGGLTTSTTVVRNWRRGTRTMHHIVDPRTGEPAAGLWRTVSVSAPCALAANVASTAAVVLGAEAVGWLERRGLAARLVGIDGQILSTAGWPAAAELAVAS
jgi:thiamine biosynthesis lipoprotein